MSTQSNKVAFKGGTVTHYMSAETKQRLARLVKKTKMAKSALIADALVIYENNK